MANEKHDCTTNTSVYVLLEESAAPLTKCSSSTYIYDLPEEGLRARDSGARSPGLSGHTYGKLHDFKSYALS